MHLEILGRLGIPTAALHADLYLGISREAQMIGDPFRAVDHCFTADGDPACQKRFKEMGINHHWLPPAVDDDACYIADVPYEHDLVFIGSWRGYHREYPYGSSLWTGSAAATAIGSSYTVPKGRARCVAMS